MEKPYQQSTIEGGFAFVTPGGFVRLRLAFNGRSSLSDEKRNFRLAKSVRPSRYELRFELDLDGWTSRGHERVALTFDRPSRELVLHALDLIIQRAAIAGGPTMTDVAYDGEAETATLPFDGEGAAGERPPALEWSGPIPASLRGP